VVQVKVLEVDAKRKRISLTMRMDDQPGAKPEKPARQDAGARESRREKPQAERARHEKPRSEKPRPEKPKTAKDQVKRQLEKQKKQPENALAAAFAKAMGNK